MAVTISEVGIGRAVLETVLLDGTMRMRVTRVPSASCAGYILYRSRSRTGWSGVSTDDASGYEQVTTLAQFGASVPFAMITDSSPPSGVDLYYRLRAVDNTTTPTEFGAWSNIAAWHYTNSRQAAVPTWPMEIRPNFGPLKGIIEELQDSDGGDGPTWYELRLTMAALADTIQTELAHRAGENAVLRVMMDPPMSLQTWFGYGVASEFIPMAELHPDRLNPAVLEAREITKTARVAFLEDPTIRLPGSSDNISPRMGRLTRG